MKKINQLYPLSTTAIILSKKDRIANNFDKIHEIIEQCINNKEVISTIMHDIKYYTNEFVSYAFELNVSDKFQFKGEYEKLPESLKYISQPRDVRSIKSYKKNLEKIPLADKENLMYKEAMVLINELYPIYEKMEELKLYIVKASEKKKQEKEEKIKKESDWQKKMLGHKDNIVVFDMLKNKLNDIYNDLYNEYLIEFKKIVSTYNEVLQKENKDYREIFKNDIQALFLLQRIVKKEIKTYKIIDNYEKFIEKEAKDAANEIINQFVYKNTGKLAYIIYHKDNLKDFAISNISTRKGSIECDVICNFKDNSEFIANTSIVRSYSKYGKPFYRYPTIFRNVTLINGEKLTNSSEEKMDTIFVKKI